MTNESIAPAMPTIPRPELILEKDISLQIDDKSVGKKVKGSFNYEVIGKNENEITIAIKNLMINGKRPRRY